MVFEIGRSGAKVIPDLPQNCLPASLPATSSVEVKVDEFNRALLFARHYCIPFVVKLGRDEV